MDPNSIQPVQSPPTFTPTPVPSVPDSDKGIPIFVLVILLATVIGSLVFLYFFLQRNTHQTISIPTPTQNSQEPSLSSITAVPTPTPIILKPDEGTKGNYTVSQNAKDTGPRFSKVTFDPLDVQKGQTLTITVTLSSQSPVSSVTGALTGDTTSTPIALQKISETAATSVWSAAFSVTDTLLYTYMLKVDAVNGTGTSSVTVAPRS